MNRPKFPIIAIPSDMPENGITGRITGRAIAVHREPGPGLIEEVFEKALDIECKLDGLHVSRQFKVSIIYPGQTICEYKPDMLVNDLW